MKWFVALLGAVILGGTLARSLDSGVVEDAGEDVRRWEGVDLTGERDSTGAIERAIAARAGKVLRFPRGTYRVRTVAVSRPVDLRFEGARWIQAPGETNVALDVRSGYVTVRGLEIDGLDAHPAGMRVGPHLHGVRIEECRVHHLASGGAPVAAVGLFIDGDGDAEVRGCEFHDFTGTPNGVVGDRIGMVAGIEIGNPWRDGATAPKRVVIEDCGFRNLLPGEDSDGIKITSPGRTWQEGLTHVAIVRCRFHNCGKRDIKLGAGGVVVDRCEFSNDFDGSIQAAGWAGTGGRKRQYAVVSVYGHWNTILDSTFRGGARQYAIDVSSNEFNADHLVVQGCRFLDDPRVAQTNDVGYGIASFQGAARRVLIRGNVIEARSSVILSFAPDSDWQIVSNVFRNTSGVTNGAAIVIGAWITNYSFQLQSNYWVTGNTFARWSKRLLVHNATGVWPTGNLALEGTGGDTLEPRVLAPSPKVPGAYYLTNRAGQILGPFVAAPRQISEPTGTPPAPGDDQRSTTR